MKILFLFREAAEHRRDSLHVAQSLIMNEDEQKTSGSFEVPMR